jgi:predicted mannosyl-3-phosphoglycerate phosphatase (HAD superfamily)
MPIALLMIPHVKEWSEATKWLPCCVVKEFTVVVCTDDERAAEVGTSDHVQLGPLVIFGLT